MPDTYPLPEQFVRAPFSRGAFEAAGGWSGRLRNRDVLRPFHGVQAITAPESLLDRCRAYAVRLRPGQFFSHVTAAGLLTFPLPRTLEQQKELDVSAVMPAMAPRTRGVRGHRLRVAPRVVEHRGLPVTSAPETWCQIAPLLPGDELVVAADHVLRLLPGRPERARKAMQTAIDRPGRLDRARLLLALAESRPGCMSAGETRVRLLLTRAGLPEAVLNEPVRAENGAVLGRPDLAWPHRRVGLEYEGEHHFEDAEQYRYDVGRYELFRDAGWTIVRVIDDDLRGERASALIARMRTLLL